MEISDPKLRERVEWMERHVKIQNPRRGPAIPLVFTPLQWEFIVDSAAWRLSGESDVCVKPRQVGVSTINLGHCLSLCVFEPGISILWVSQDEDNAKAMRRKFKVIYGSACDSLGSGITRNDIVVNNPTEFTLSNGSSISFLWSGDSSKTSSNVGRGDTFHFIVFTEFAYWATPQKTWEAIRPAVEHAGASVVYDSTPNGITGRGELFYRRAVQARDGRPGLKLHFWPWFKDGRYRKPYPAGEFEYKPLTREEQEGVDVHGWDLNQVYWRRYQIEEYGGNVEVFLEIYPESFIGAFRSSAVSIFDRNVIRRATARLSRYGMQLEDSSRLTSRPIATNYHGSSILSSSRLIDDPRGYFRVFRAPVPGMRYYAGLDASQGIFDGDTNKTDWVCLSVVDEDARYCALLRCKIAAISVGWMSQLILGWYGDASMDIEDASTGPDIHRYLIEEIGDREIERYNASPILSTSYPHCRLVSTNTSSRPLLVNQLIQALNEETTQIPDDETLAEAVSLERDPKTGKVAACQGQHDDILFSLAIALRCRELSLTRWKDGSEKEVYKIKGDDADRPRHPHPNPADPSRRTPALAGGRRREQQPVHVGDGDPLKRRGCGQARGIWGVLG